MSSEKNKSRTGRPARPTFYLRVLVLAETIARRPKNEVEKQEAERVMALMRREEASALKQSA